LTQAVQANRDWNSETEKQDVLKTLGQAEEVYEKLGK